MKNFAKISYFISISFFVIFLACNQSKNSQNKNETILKGKTTVLVDETLQPIIEDQIAVFESKYDNSKIDINAKSETEVVQALLKDSSDIAILTRTLSPEESKIFSNRKITPKITKFATDAIAFIANKNNNDSLIALEDVVHFMQGKSNTKIKGLVFDNPNSSTVRYMNEKAGLKAIPEKGVFSFKTNEEVIRFVSENDGMIGIVGLNWLSQPTGIMKDYVNKINLLSVKGINSNAYYTPTQNNIAEGKYPLARDLYIINCQGFSGLGMGFSSFIAGDIGQRIILKSGLLPIRVPGRNIIVRKKIDNKKK